jgi:hypothetical protein
MTENQKKILKMVAEGTITPEEAEDLWKGVQEESGEDDFQKFIKKDLEKAKEDLIKAKDWFTKEFNKIDLNSVKQSVKQGIEKLDEALLNVDKKLQAFGQKVKEKFNKEKEE